MKCSKLHYLFLTPLKFFELEKSCQKLSRGMKMTCLLGRWPVLEINLCEKHGHHHCYLSKIL